MEHLRRPPKKRLFQQTLKGDLRNIESRFRFEGLSVSRFRIMMVYYHLDPEKIIVLACPGAAFLHRHKWTAAKYSERLLLF